MGKSRERGEVGSSSLVAGMSLQVIECQGDGVGRIGTVGMEKTRDLLFRDIRWDQL